MSSISELHCPSVHVPHATYSSWATKHQLCDNIILFLTGSVQLTDLQGVIGGGLSDFCAVFYRQHLDNVLSSRLMRFVAQLQQICAASCLCLIEIDRRLIAAKGRGRRSGGSRRQFNTPMGSRTRRLAELRSSWRFAIKNDCTCSKLQHLRHERAKENSTNF